MRGHRAFWTAAVLMLLIAGCGVQPSGVITGASPPSGRVEPGISVTLYLLANGQLTPVQRHNRPRSRIDTLALLATGPTGEERARGFSSEVPRSAAPFSLAIRPPDQTVVTVSSSGNELSDTAIDQIVCTAAKRGEYTTVLAGGQFYGPRACPVLR